MRCYDIANPFVKPIYRILSEKKFFENFGKFEVKLFPVYLIGYFFKLSVSLP